MDLAQLETEINAVWDARDTVTVDTKGAVRDAVASALDMLDSGSARVAEPLGDHQWRVNQWLKKAVLLSFRLNDMQSIPSGTIFQGAGESMWWDKIAPKCSGWDDSRFRAAGFRAVPGCIVRHSAHIAPNAVLMPSFINLGAYVGSPGPLLGLMLAVLGVLGACVGGLGMLLGLKLAVLGRSWRSCWRSWAALKAHVGGAEHSWLAPGSPAARPG